jgi:hypothetical protein
VPHRARSLAELCRPLPGRGHFLSRLLSLNAELQFGRLALAGLNGGVEHGVSIPAAVRICWRIWHHFGQRPIAVRAFDHFAVLFQTMRVGQLDAAIPIDSTA